MPATKMTKKAFKAALLIESPTCCGDLMSNEYINIIAALPCNGKAVRVYRYMVDVMTSQSDDWACRVFTKKEIRQLAVIVKSSEKMYEKRLLSYVKAITSGYYSYLFNKTRIEKFDRIFNLNLSES